MPSHSVASSTDDPVARLLSHAAAAPDVQALARGIGETLLALELDPVIVQAGTAAPLVAAGLLSQEALAAEIGTEATALTRAVLALPALEAIGGPVEQPTPAQAENLRKLLLAVSDDVRVLLIKLADRLHNMRTLEFVPPASRQRIAEETLDIYAPLAGRMGMQEMREELEDLSFRTLDPEAYAVVMQRLNALAERNRNLIGEIESQLSKNLRKNGLTAHVYGRRKQPFSIWTKMERKSVGFEQLSDIFGFRVVLPDLESCYRALGVVHTTWPVVPGRFKDYISTPKQNDYRSIHTTVIGPGNQRVELQIRTEEMHQIAEFGIAAHVFYKEGIGSPTEMLNRESNAFAWLRRTVGMLSESANPEEFLEHTKLELFHDQVFCFTPKGKLIALPRHANVIDFAYAVHTDVGNSAVGCKINGKFAPLSSELQNGDEVEVMTSEAQSAPPSAWESLAVTGKARAAIRRATRTAVRDQYAGLGRRIVERLFERAKIDYADDKLKGALPRLARASVDDVMAAVGRGEMKASDVARAMYPDYREERVARYGAPKKSSLAVKLKLKSPPPEPPRSPHAIPVRGINSDLPVKFAPNGGAVPGDRIVGIVTPGEGITIYPIQSPALKDFEEEPERWLDVRWDVDEESTPQRFPARILVDNVNEPGSLAQVATVIAEHDGNIDNISMSRRSPDFTELTIDLEVYDLKHLSAIIAQLRAKAVVARVERVNG